MYPITNKKGAFMTVAEAKQILGPRSDITANLCNMNPINPGSLGSLFKFLRRRKI